MCRVVSQFSKLKKKDLLCNVYRLPCYLAADIDLFTAEFSNFLRSVRRSHSSVFICGNFNINLLSINVNAHFADYFKSVLAAGFFPKITFPTRIQDNYHTLIDQISGAPNSAKFRGGLQRASQDRQRGGCNIWFYFPRVKNITF